MLRWRRIAIVAGLLAFIVPTQSHAGFYNPNKLESPILGTDGPAPIPFDLFRDMLNETLLIRDTLKSPNSIREAVKKRLDELLKLGSRITVPDLAELGLLQWRLGEADRAMDTLNRAKAQDPRSFWALTQLGSLYFATGQYAEAAGHLGPANSMFPSPWPGPAAAGKWFRQCERAQLTVLHSRMREAGARATRRTTSAAEVDALFPVKFAGPAGEYEPGKIPDEEKAKLPADAIATVQQLLIWYPEDTRLYWLLGELYNATGDIRSAEKIFDDCVSGSRRFDSPALRDHRRIIKEAIEAENAAEAAKKESFWPSTQTMAVVGGLGAVIIGLLLFLQIRELVRRLRRAP